MSDYSGLASSRYVVEDYLRVSDLWEQFASSGDEHSLRKAAEVMCGTLGRLSGDGEFWAAVVDAIGDLEDEGDAVRKVLADIGEFREFEVRALTKFGVRPDQASRLTSDLVNAIRLVEELPKGPAIENLRSHVATLGEQMCAVASTQPPNWRRRVAKGMRVLGGAAAVVVDGATAPVAILTALSIGGGVGAIAAEFVDH